MSRGSEDYALPPLLLGWPQIEAAGVAAVGGKAHTLARLARHGFAVPAALVVPAWVGRQWLAPLAALATGAAPAPSGLGQAGALAAAVAAQASQPLPPALLAALDAALAQPPWPGVALAVRSSAAQEDSARASFAGIHRSLLNVQGRDALGEALRAVWLSAWSEAALAYRQRLGLAHGAADMALLLMPMVAARASGIAFTCDPASGRDDRLLIHANWGLGESLVGCEAQGDEAVFAVDPQDDALRLLDYRIGAKAATRQPRAGGGTQRVDSAPAAAAAAALPASALPAIANQLRLAALALADGAQPMDLEWAWDGQRLHLLQARPVTVRARCTYPALQAQPDIWSRGNTKDVMPEPLSPIEWTLAGLTDAMLASGPQAAGATTHPGAVRARVINGRMYLNLALLQWEFFVHFGVAPQATNALVGGHQGVIAVPALGAGDRRRHLRHLLRYTWRAHALRRRGRREAVLALAELHAARQQAPPADDAALAAALRAQVRQGRGRAGLQFMQGSAGGSAWALIEAINRHLPGEGAALASALLADAPPPAAATDPADLGLGADDGATITAQQGRALVRLARLAQADPAARDWLARRHAQPVPDDDWQALPAQSPFRRAMAAFLHHCGHRAVYETYLRRPRWVEAPGYLLDQLPALAAVDLDAQAARCAAQAAAARLRVRGALPWPQRLALRWLVRKAQQELRDREAARSALIADLEPARRLLLAVGTRWQQRGWLERPEDVFLLLLPELLAVLDGERPGAALRGLAEERRRTMARRMAEDAPDVIVGEPSALGVATAASRAPPGPADAPPPATANDAAVLLRGVAIGGGSAQGTARRVQAPHDGARLAAGEVLVAPSTDPGWTPLFLRAAALVMETGGLLSHGAIVAREFGLPAVVNVAGAMRVLRDGAPVTVDGNAGTVRQDGA